jgi:endo-1,4-beta-mannosidase
VVGANFLPSNAINQLEMFQADTFDSAEIDKELGWAESLGMNTVRVYLHDLLWQQDEEGFKNRLDQFLTICSRHHIRPILVLFDSCWDPSPHSGTQRPPVPGIHNSGWVQSPGKNALLNAEEYPRLRKYIEGIVAAFADDQRILLWDVWNEPDNNNASSYGKEEPKNKEELVRALLPQVFSWVRSVHPAQPLTSGIWAGDWSSPGALSAMARLQVEESDVISFHNYSWPEDFETRVTQLQRYGRPLFCTEYMARGAGSIFDTILPIAKKYNVAMINWGLVAGKSQTYLPWDSWQRPYVQEQPTVWFHDIFHSDGTPYRQQEVKIIRELTNATVAPKR